MVERSEKTELEQCEAVIRNGLETFVEVGTALLVIRDKRLYRAAGFSGFADYCEKRWRMSDRHARRLMGAAEVVANIGPMGPISERQVRPLTNIPPEQQREVWHKAVETTNGKPTEKAVRAAVELVTKPSIVGKSRDLEMVETLPSAKKATFNETNDKVSWARWTWNPVTGCLHDCAYCYARDIANRFYPQGFQPTFHADRLGAPANTPLPKSDDPKDRRVFTCSMADLFGNWVPQEWIDAVFEQMRDNPQWEYLCLTKFPQRLASLDWPDNAWMGTTVDRQYRVEIAEKAFRKVKAGVKWLSCEPLLEPLKFTSLEMFDWVVIGGASRSSQTEESWPEFEWVVDLYNQARAAGCRVWVKPNGIGDRTPVPREFPR
jgi:protein gp37